MRMKKTGLTLAALLAATTLVGCGAEDGSQKVVDAPASAAPGGAGDADGGFLKSLQDRGDLVTVYRSLEEAAAAESIVATGVIDRVAAGRTTVQTTAPGLEARDQTAVVRIRIVRVYKAADVKLDDAFAYVTLRRGAEATAADGAPIGAGPSTVTSIGALGKALPSGTRVILVTSPVPPPRPGADSGRVVTPEAGTSHGAPLLEGDVSQLFSIEDGDGRLTGWPSMTYDDAVAALEKAFP
ncbi:hypothetical protein GCM10022237_47700 [Nocardioides ginsengisoli]|uniref:Uncharacterized protein n=1 Tax=Nocardioides ginsengisoli TaxID=363868 RepID=A0ABW3W4V8_9ACTN